MLRSIRFTAPIVTFLCLIFCTTGHATMEITIQKGLNLGWYFHNTSAVYTVLECGCYAYYRDYDKDGKQDFMIEMRQPLEKIGSSGNPLGPCNVRYFAINTTPDGKEKTYAANKTAWRDFPAQYGTFVPSMHCFTGAATILYVDDKTLAYPDIIATGDNRASVSGTYTKFVFRRLDGTKTDLPTLKEWSVPVVSSRNPVFMWLKTSANADTYPDYLVYHQKPDSSKKFVVTCYDGKTGTDIIWSATIPLASDDPNTGVTFGGYSIAGTPTMQIIPLATLYSDTKADFDGNGKPEIPLYYTFGKGDMMGTFGMHANVTMLNSSGKFLSPYSSAWARVEDVSGTIVAPVPYCSYDLNDDQYLDLMLTTPATMDTSGAQPPVFRAFNLKSKSVLYSSTNADFGSAAAGDLQMFSPCSVLTSSNASHGDINGDAKGDLLLYRPLSDNDTGPIRIGSFNGNAAGGALKGRKMYLTEFANYNSAFPSVNDFNKDGIMDLVVAKSPDAPNTVSPGKVTWNIANVILGKAAATVARQFTYSGSHEFAYSPLTDSFTAASYLNGLKLDLDADGVQDTCCAFSSYVDKNNDGTKDSACGYLVVYDNPAGSGTPPINAEMRIKVTGENWEAAPLLSATHTHERTDWVDNNADSKKNDFLAAMDQAILYVSATGDRETKIDGAWTSYK